MGWFRSTCIMIAVVGAEYNSMSAATGLKGDHSTSCQVKQGLEDLIFNYTATSSLPRPPRETTPHQILLTPATSAARNTPHQIPATPAARNHATSSLPRLPCETTPHQIPARPACASNPCYNYRKNCYHVCSRNNFNTNPSHACCAKPRHIKSLPRLLQEAMPNQILATPTTRNHAT